MENASKALLMAGGVLIGILVLSLAVYLFITFGASSKEINARIEDNQLIQFNAQFNIYADRTDIKIHDIISLANLAKENNEYYKSYNNYEDSYKIQIMLQNTTPYSGEAQGFSETKKQELIKKYSEVNYATGEVSTLFTCLKVEYHENGRVSKVVFKLN